MVSVLLIVLSNPQEGGGVLIEAGTECTFVKVYLDDKDMDGRTEYLYCEFDDEGFCFSWHEIAASKVRRRMLRLV